MSAAATLCIFRLSALGDVTHLLPLVHRIRRHQPDTRITWIIGKFESKLVADLPGVEFVAIDKKQGLLAVGPTITQDQSGRRVARLLSISRSMRSSMTP